MIVFNGHSGELVDIGEGKNWGIIYFFFSVAFLVVVHNNYPGLDPVWFNIRVTLDVNSTH